MSAQSIYEPIKWWQIRLLKLRPGKEDELLRGELPVANVVEAESGVALHVENEYVEYEALSYCWGNPELTTDIVVNELPTKVTTSLGDALRRLRRKRHHRWIWCDALCINQKDDLEKSHQVQKILTIFSRASKVVIWLGDAGVHTAEAMSYIQYEMRKKRRERVEDGDSFWKVSEEVCSGLCDLYSRPWILRIWVQQETYAARRAVIYCGPDKMDFAMFKQAAVECADLFATDEMLVSTMSDSARILGSLPSANRERQAQLDYARAAGEAGPCRCSSDSPARASFRSKWVNPECALYHLGGLNASRPADHVYSVLGMTNCRVTSDQKHVQDLRFPTSQQSHDHGRETKKHSLTIDFSRSASRVFQDMTKYILDRDGHLGLLVGHIPVSTDKNDLGLPSWCPDYRHFESHFMPDSLLYGFEREPGQGMQNIPRFQFPVLTQSEQEPGRLKVHGVKIAEVVRDGTTASEHSSRPFHTQRLEVLISDDQQAPNSELGTRGKVNESSSTGARLNIVPEIRGFVCRTIEEGRYLLNVDVLAAGDVLMTSGRFNHLYYPDQIVILVLRPISGEIFQYVDQTASHTKEVVHPGSLFKEIFGQSAEELRTNYERLAQDFDIV